MIMTCELCGNEFLTEADPYVVQNTPQGQKYYCNCMIKENINGNVMNNKDKEAFDNWIDNDVLSHDDNNKFKNMSEQERIVFVTERTWQAALEYERFNHRYCVVGLVEKLQAENKALRKIIHDLVITGMDSDIAERLEEIDEE